MPTHDTPSGTPSDSAATPSATGTPAVACPLGSMLVVDGNSWMHRAFHAINQALSAPDGRPTNAVFGFMSMLVKAIEELQPTAVVVAFDDGKPAFRLEALEQYKVHRPPTDPILKAQFPTIEALLQTLDIPVVKLPGWEGDDILGTLATAGKSCGLEVYLATGDRDAYQLVNETVAVVTSKKGVSDLVIVRSADVLDRYGVTPAQVPDYLGLKGDPSDNIPGVPGIGEKTASKLIAEYGTLEAVIEAAKAGAITGRAGQNLVEHEGAAYASRTVATIVCDVPMDIDLTQVRFGDFDTQRVIDAFGELRLRAPLAKVLRLHSTFTDAGSTSDSSRGADPALGARAAAPAPSEHIAETSGTTTGAVTSGSACMTASPGEVGLPQAELRYTGVATSVLGETLFDTSVLLSESRGTLASTRCLEDDAAYRRLVELAASGEIAALDLKATLELVYPSDGAEPAQLDIDTFDPERAFDIGVAAYLLESRRTDFSLDTLGQDYLGYDYLTGETVSSVVVGDDEPAESARHRDLSRDARTVSRLAQALSAAMDSDGDTQRVFRDIEMPLIPVLARMERAGIALDVDFLAGLALDGRQQIDALREEIYELAGEEFVIDSPKQLSVILFEKLGLPTGKKTKTGFSTDASVLQDLVAAHPIARALMSYRELTKLQSTYIEALPRLVRGDGRVHTSFNQTVAATGRLSSSNPNLQNIPVRTELGRRIRQAFVPGQSDWVIVSADYSQIELRVLAHLSQDPGLIEAFTSGVDFHTATAARIFGADPDQVDPGMRSRAKAVNFGIVYGQGARALGLSLEIPSAEAQGIIDRYYATFPQVKSYLDGTIAFAQEYGWIATAFGRKRHIPEMQSHLPQMRAFGNRTAMNHPMQGTAADLIKIAMLAVDRRLRQDGFQARMLLQVHDELVFEAPAAEVERLSDMVTQEMSGAAQFLVPLDVSVSVGPTWAEAK